MADVVATSWSCTQAPSERLMPISAAAIRALCLWDVLAFMVLKPSSHSIGDKAVGAAIALCRLGAAGHAVNAVDRSEQLGLRIGCRGEAVVGTRQILLCDSAHDVGRHDHGELGLVVDE